MNNTDCGSLNVATLAQGKSVASPAIPDAIRLKLSKLNRVLSMLLRSFLIALALVAAGSYVALSPPGLTTLWPGLILCPLKANLADYQIGNLDGTNPEDIYFTNRSGNRLHGWFFQSINPRAHVLLFNHGNSGNVSCNVQSVSRFLKLGLSVFIYDYQGYGKSAGKATMAEALKDGESAYDYLTQKRNIQATDIILYGGSFGGSIACHLAESRQASALLIESTFSSLGSVGRKKISFLNMYPSFLKPIPALDSGVALHSSHIPLLIIHGQQDHMIPFSEAEENYAQASQPKTLLVMPNSDHAVADSDLEIYISGIKSFLAKL